MIAYCTYCGKQVEPAACYCARCGSATGSLADRRETILWQRVGLTVTTTQLLVGAVSCELRNVDAFRVSKRPNYAAGYCGVMLIAAGVVFLIAFATERESEKLLLLSFLLGVGGMALYSRASALFDLILTTPRGAITVYTTTDAKLMRQLRRAIGRTISVRAKDHEGTASALDYAAELAIK